MREKLIELLNDIQRCGEDFDDYEIYGMRLPNSVSNDDVADHLIANGVTIQKWIPVTERLPEKSGEYLTLDDYGLRTVLEFSEAHQAFNASDYIPNDSEIHCTHWMPLPEPPKGE